MAWALVGSLGAASQGTIGAAVTPAYGQTPTAGNLLVLWCAVTQVAGNPGTPSGWTAGPNILGTSCFTEIYFKVAAGGDAQPTLAAVASGFIAGQLGEFSGLSGVKDQQASFASTTSPLTRTFGGTDAATAELLVIATADARSVARSPNDTLTSNHVTAVTQAGNNNGTSSQNHYSFGYGTTNNNGTADDATLTCSVTTSITGLAIAACTFLLAPGRVQYVSPMPQLIAQ